MPDGRFVLVLRDPGYVKIGDELHGPLWLEQSGSGSRSILVGTTRFAFVYRSAGSVFVHWNGKSLGPFLHTAATVLSDDRVVVAHADAGGNVTVEEHS